MITPSSSATHLASLPSSSPELLLSPSPPRRALSPFRVPADLPYAASSPGLVPTTSPSTATTLPLLSRPAPVVPSHASPMSSPLLSRPSSPRDVRNADHGQQGETNHIFERDVEFSHSLQPREAVDVAVPAVLTEAACALSLSDSLGADEFASIVSSHRSGWESPGVVSPRASSSRSASVSRAFEIAHQRTIGGGASGTGRTVQGREDSLPVPPLGLNTVMMVGGGNEQRDGVGNRSRSTSPSNFGARSASNASPPTSSLSHRMGERSLSGRSISSAASGPSSRLHLSFGNLSFSPHSASSTLTPTSPLPLSSPTIEMLRKDAELSPSVSLDKLSFSTYADLLNEERMAELTGTARGEES